MKTQVATDHGEQAIGTLTVGEQVLAYNPRTKKMEYQPILHVWLNHDTDLVDLTLTTKQHAPHSTVVTTTREVIHTNKKHPFFTEKQGFIPVAQITIGMYILRADGSYGIVTGYRLVPGTTVMYNLTVAQDHTFTVGNGQWVVHNCTPSPNRFPGRLAGELEDAQNAGVQTWKIGDSGLTQAIKDAPNGELSFKWAVDTNGELGIIPSSVEGVEIHHSVLFNGADVLSAGEGVFTLDGSGNYILEYLDNTSGHYFSGDLAAWDAAYNTVGIPAFQDAGVIFNPDDFYH